MDANSIRFSDGYKPFRPVAGKTDPTRGLTAPGGVADRLRLVAFAELQARDLFLYGVERFGGEVP